MGTKVWGAAPGDPTPIESLHKWVHTMGWSIGPHDSYGWAVIDTKPDVVPPTWGTLSRADRAKVACVADIDAGGTVWTVRPPSTSRIACTLTIPQVCARIKTETRRGVTTWRRLRPSDRLTLIEQGMGLPKGGRHVVIGHAVVESVAVEPLSAITVDGVAREGFPRWTVDQFIGFWAEHHRVARDAALSVPVRVIRWRYTTPESGWG